MVVTKKNSRKFNKLTKFLETKKSVTFMTNMEKMVLKTVVLMQVVWTIYSADSSAWEAEADNSRPAPRRENQ